MIHGKQSVEEDKDERIIKRMPGEIGYFLINKNLEKALWYFDQALEELPEECYCLLGRAETRKRLLDSHGAVQDIKTLLKLNPRDLRAHALKNEILFLRRHYEKALILNDECLKVRKKPDDFFLGHMKCMDAILNAVTKERAGHPLRDHYKIIRRIAWENAWKRGGFAPKKCHKKDKQTKKTLNSTVNLLIRPPPRLKHQYHSPRKNSSADTVIDSLFSTTLHNVASDSSSEIQESISTVDSKWIHLEMPYIQMSQLIDFPYKPLQARTTNLANYLSEKYLEKLHKDKRFLDTMVHTKSLNLPNAKGVEELVNLIQKGYKYLDKLQHFMRCKRPFYHIKYQERKVTINVKTKMDLLLRKQREEVKQSFHKVMHRLRLAYDLKNMKAMEKIIENFIELYETQPKTVINDQYENIVEALNMMRDAHYYFGLFSPSMTEQQKIERVKFRLGIHMERTPSNDSFITNFKRHTPVNWQSRIKQTEKRLKNVHFPEEFIFFNYELARMHLETGRYDLVVSFAARSIAQAREIRRMRWVVNAKIITAKACIKQNNKVYAVKILEKTLLISKTLYCPELIEFLTCALDVLAVTDFNIFSQPRTINIRRQKQILKLLKDNEHSKREAEEVFKRQSFCSTSRTMSLVPGVAMTDKPRKNPRPAPMAQIKDQMSTTPPLKISKKRRPCLHDNILDYISVENEPA